MTEPTDVFERSEKLPSPTAAERYADLVGLDDIKERLLKDTRLLLKPKRLEEWSRTHHGDVLPVVRAFAERVPLFVFAGDVGTGKTQLAETFGDALARAERISVTLMRLSLNARGTGRVGEMTGLIATAFCQVEERVAGQRKLEEPNAAVVLLIDEADALAQSRDASQMHHEDRAGVNALIRGIDHVSTASLPVITVMCTNRPAAIDPAIERRAAQIFEFARPNDEQRRVIFERAFAGTGMTAEELHMLVELTGRIDGVRHYGYTYSDLTLRLIPSAVLDAVPGAPLTAARVAELITHNPPTVPFGHRADD